MILHFGLFAPVASSLIADQWSLPAEHLRFRHLLAALPGANQTDHARLWAATSITLAAAACALIASALALLAMLSPRRRKPLLWIAAILALPLAHPLVGWNGLLPLLFGALNLVAPIIFIMEAQSNGSVRRKLRALNAILSIDLPARPPQSARARRTAPERSASDPPSPNSAAEQCRPR